MLQRILHAQASGGKGIQEEATTPADAVAVHDVYVPPGKLHLVHDDVGAPSTVDEAPAPAPAAAIAAPAPAPATRPDYSIADEDDGLLLIHFIPPPLRDNTKRDLPWIVHSSDGSGCREAKHVSIHAVSGFETYEGQPPEQVEGLTCSCAIANHHLRGFGRVRWQGQSAIIEHSGGGGGSAVNVRAYRDDAQRQASQLSSAKTDAKKLREVVREQSERLLAYDTRVSNEEKTLKELSATKQKKAVLEERYRALAAKYDAAKAELQAVCQPAEAEAEPSVLPEANANAERRPSDDGELESKQLLKCFDWVLVCIAPPRAGAML